ncbi:MAG: AMP-binding protein [Thermoplasmatales archaeon]|nr:AMP-binding protein [Thermoplasmatales archaeon]
MSKEKPTISRGIARVVFSKFAKKYLRQYGWFKLKKSIRYAYDTSPFYHKLFKKYHVKPSDIKSFKDMNKIPFTNPEDLQDDPKSFFSVSENKFVKVFTTAGTTGKPKKVYFTKKDLNRLVSSAETGMQLMYNITHRDIIRISFDEGYGIEVWGNRYCLDRAFGRIGAMTISMGKLAVEDELKILREYKPTILTDTSSRINYLTNEMKKIYNLETLGINKILIGAEPTPNAMRKNIENTWNADAFIGYGLTEIGLLSGGECEKKQGMHLSEMDFLTEVVDPKTGEQVEDGEIGELIFTTYDREGMPLIRYRSHDLGKIIPEMCSCGLPLKRIEIKGRTDDMIPIGSGDNLYSRNFDDVLFGISEVADYQIIFDRKDGKDHLTVVVETELIKETIRKKIFDAVINIPRIKNGVFVSKTIEKPNVELVKQNTLNRKSIKAKRIVDNRNLYD